MATGLLPSMRRQNWKCWRMTATEESSREQQTDILKVSIPWTHQLVMMKLLPICPVCGFPYHREPAGGRPCSSEPNAYYVVNSRPEVPVWGIGRPGAGTGTSTDTEGGRRGRKAVGCVARPHPFGGCGGPPRGKKRMMSWAEGRSRFGGLILGRLVDEKRNENTFFLDHFNLVSLNLSL